MEVKDEDIVKKVLIEFEMEHPGYHAWKNSLDMKLVQKTIDITRKEIKKTIIEQSQKGKSIDSRRTA